MLGMLPKDPFEISRESYVVTTENSHSDNEAEALGSVVRVPKTARKAEFISPHFEVEDSEELDPVPGDCVLYLHAIDMPDGFEERNRHQQACDRFLSPAVLIERGEDSRDGL